MSNKQVEVNIAGQPYRFAISPDNEAALLEAVALVDDKMNKLKGSVAAKGVERVAVMAARRKRTARSPWTRCARASANSTNAPTRRCASTPTWARAEPLKNPAAHA